MLKKVALISDIQGNLTALKQVLAQIKMERVDRIICLGDVASGAQPSAVLALLREYHIHVVKGNMDDAILNPRRHDTTNLDVQRFDDIDQWCSEQLTDLDKVYIRSFRPTILVDLVGEKQLLCCHGSPYSYNDVIDETISETQLAQRIDGYNVQIMATGHMHHPLIRPFRDTLIFNPGSVGLPRKRNGKHPPLAYFAILDIIDEQINMEFRSVAVPPDDLKRDILSSGMPHTEWFLSQWDVDN
jgi:putative phosphoesterase